MRKKYCKPEILFESFAGSTNIAAGCEVITNTPSARQCGIYLEGVGNTFITGMSGCADFGVPDNGQDTEFGNICYHVPSDTLFNS